VRVHLVDGTYELFRQYLAPRPGHLDDDGIEVGATRAVVSSMLTMLEEGATHLGVATDHVIESFRNGLWAEYKTGAGIEPDLLAQFPLLEEALSAAGVVVWPMIEFEADDALAAGAAAAAADARVDRVMICTPDKDLAQCVRGTRVVMLDRRRRRVMDEDGVKAKFGVLPESIPDWLALVGDSSDGYPGLPGWGPKTAAALLSRYHRLEDIPGLDESWAVAVRGAAGAGQVLRDRRADALLYRQLARLRTDVPLAETLDDLRWQGARREELSAICAETGESEVAARMPLWRDG
jgi:5'-3' exonuclease